MLHITTAWLHGYIRVYTYCVVITVIITNKVCSHSAVTDELMKHEYTNVTCVTQCTSKGTRMNIYRMMVSAADAPVRGLSVTKGLGYW